MTEPRKLSLYYENTPNGTVRLFISNEIKYLMLFEDVKEFLKSVSAWGNFDSEDKVNETVSFEFNSIQFPHIKALLEMRFERKVRFATWEEFSKRTSVI